MKNIAKNHSLSPEEILESYSNESQETANDSQINWFQDDFTKEWGKDWGKDMWRRTI
jgi:hypothetical protein